MAARPRREDEGADRLRLDTHLIRDIHLLKWVSSLTHKVAVPSRCQDGHPKVAVLALFSDKWLSCSGCAFATSFDEVVVTLYLAGPEQATLPRVMFSGIRENISPTIAAAATLLILTSVLMLLTLEWLRGRAEKMKAQIA